MNYKYYLMRKFLLILIVSIFSPLVNADKPDAPIPPQTLKAVNIKAGEASDVLLNKISSLIEKKENNYTSAQLILVQDKQIILNYEYQYAWRTSDVVQQTLIYQKINSTWSLVDTLNFSTKEKSIVGDLTGDGLTEIIVFNESGFRTTIMSEETIMISNAVTGKYSKSDLMARTDATAGECRDINNTYENISVEKSKASPIVVITLKKTKVSAISCDETPVYTSRREYEWSAKQKKFISVSVLSSLLRWVSTLM